MDDVLTELRLLSDSLDRQSDATTRLLTEHGRAIAKTWDDLAALRDETHDSLAALANRLESLARGLTVDPAQVAESMFTVRRYPNGTADCADCEGSGTRDGGKTPCVTCGGFGRVHPPARLRDADA